MVMGFRPYDINTTSNFELQTKIVNEPLPLTGTNWDSLIQKATEKDSQHRYADISAFRSAWQKGQNVSTEKNIIHIIEEEKPDRLGDPHHRIDPHA